MATLTLDTVEDAELLYSYGIIRRVRTGIVRDLALAPGASCSYTLEAILDILVAAGHTLAGPYTGSDGTIIAGLLLQDVQVKPVNPSDYRLILTYTSEKGFQPSTYVIEDDSCITQVETNLLPGTRIPIRVAWDAFTGPDSKEKASVPADNLTFNLMVPIRTVRITSLIYGEPTSDNQDLVGSVNNAVWYGRDIGHWMLWSYATSESRYAGYYTLQAEARANAAWVGDWSVTGVLKSSLTGKYVEIKDSDLAALLTPPYSQGIISTGGRANSGVIRVGPYPLTNFVTIFGFSTPPSRNIPSINLHPATP